MHRDALGIDAHRHGHVLDFELVNGLHTQVFKAKNLGRANGLTNKVGRATDCHEIGRRVFFDGLNSNRPAFSLTHHGNQSCLREYGLGELIHSSGRCRASGAYGLTCNWVDRPHVIDHAIGEVHR